jgi:hypothetical protein
MATTEYVVLQQGGSGESASYTVARKVTSSNALQACRLAAEAIDSESKGTALNNDGLTLIAVPARNWTSGRHTLKAETTRRIRSA